MNELYFPFVGAIAVFLVVVPALTVVARAIVAAWPFAWRGEDRPAANESAWRFLLVVGPTLGPVIWFISATIHQSEGGRPLTACVVDHLGGQLCRDVALFGLILFAVLGYGVLRRIHREHAIGVKGPRVTREGPAYERVRVVGRRNPTLAAFAARIDVVEHGVAPACTRGLFRPRVEIDAALVGTLDDDELEATLLHEVDHALGRDPLRFFVVQVALSINPLGFLLAPEVARLHFTREALCDKRAVQAGADPLALARSIVCVARPRRPLDAVARLGGHGIAGVRLRVQLLLGYAAHRPGPARPRSPVGIVTCVVVLAALWPHVIGAGLLDAFHLGIERAASVFFRLG